MTPARRWASVGFEVEERMGLLDQVIGSVLGSRTGGRGGFGGGAGGLGGMLGGGQGSGMSPVVMALLALLASRQSGQGGGLGGGLGGMVGGQGGGGLGGLLGGGGLGGLLDQFTRSGHGDKLQSWIGPGDNHPIAPNELEETLGVDTVDRLSGETGMARGDLLNELAGVLPGVVDKLTPQGRMPTDDETRHW
jgi:uncharacterized protein YidB (DUF937 family)